MKTPEYIRKAHNKYNEQFDLIQVKAPKGTKERIKAATEKSLNEYAKGVILADLERIEGTETTEQQREIEIFEGKEIYKSYNEDYYIKVLGWWRNLVYFKEDKELNALFIAFLDAEAEENNNFIDGVQIFFDLFDMARIGSKYSDAELEKMTDEEIDAIPPEDWEHWDNTEELKRLTRDFLYNGKVEEFNTFLGFGELAQILEE